MAQTLQVKCKGCYEVFEVPDQMTPDEFAQASIPTSSLPCPHCRIRRPYDKGDYFFGPTTAFGPRRPGR